MTVGTAASQANSLLDTLLGSTYAQLHTGDPGAAGTNNVSSTTTRVALTYASASGGSKALSANSVWSSWAGTNGEVVTHISIWTAISAGTFKQSVALGASRTMNTGDTLTLTTLTGSITPLAA